MKAQGIRYPSADFINTVVLGYTKFIKQHKTKSSIRGNDAIKRYRETQMDEAVPGINSIPFHSKLFQ